MNNGFFTNDEYRIIYVGVKKNGRSVGILLGKDMKKCIFGELVFVRVPPAKLKGMPANIVNVVA